MKHTKRRKRKIKNKPNQRRTKKQGIVKKLKPMQPDRKEQDSQLLEYKEREYKFDDRLVPYFLGADTKEGNLVLRSSLIKLGKTKEITALFEAMKSGNLGYREDAKEVFIKALFTIINGHDQVGLACVFDNDIEAIHDSNLKKFNTFWDAKASIYDDDEDEKLRN